MGFKRPEVQILSPRPPRRSKVRFAPTSFLLLADASAAKKPPSPRSLAPPFPQKAPLGSPVRLQARSQRLAVATNLLRLPRLAAREMGRGVHAAPKKTRRQSRQCGVRPSEKPPRRRIVRFAPTPFLLLADASAAKKPPHRCKLRIACSGFSFCFIPSPFPPPAR